MRRPARPLSVPKTTSSLTKLSAVLLAAAALVAGSLAVAAPASADSAPTNPADPTTPTTVTADVLPTPQINGVAWSQTISGNTVFVGGNFTTARPAGSAAGVNTVSRNSLLSYNLTTGALNTAFAPSANAQVKTVVASADGQYLYVGGSFTSINGVTRNRIAKLDATTGAVVTAFNPNAAYTVNALALSGNTLYLGGGFTAVGGQTRSDLAAVNATTGAVTSWAPAATGGQVTGLAVSPDGSKVAVGGAFTTLNGSSNPGYGLGAVSASTGALLPWAANSIIRDGGTQAGITSISSDANGVYGTGYVYGAGGNVEGAFRTDWNGNLVWLEDCHGDTYSIAATATVAYVASHEHYCGNLGGFPQNNPSSTWIFHRATAFTNAATQTLAANPIGGYANFAGQPAPSLLNWNPDLVAGSFTGQTQAAWSVAANSSYVVYGGEFPTVNGVAQQGLVRFAVPSIAPNTSGPVSSGANFKPNLISTAPGKVKVSWIANADRDNGTLTYRLYRDGNTTTPIYTTTQDSSTWSRPQMGFTDNGLAAGSTHSYRLRATDPFGNTVLGDSVSVTVASSALTGYPARVIADGASNYWRFDESGTTVRDFAGYDDQIAQAGVTKGASGATIDGDTAATFSGTSTGYSATQAKTAGPQTFSLEAWFKTTATGRIVGFGDLNVGTSLNYDRALYVNSSGRLVFGVNAGGQQAVTTSSSVRDGAWHQAVGTYGGGSMSLYLDGALVGTKTGVGAAQAYNGFWRVGGDSTWSGSQFLSGTIDEVSVYPAKLTTAQVQAQYSAAKTGGGTPANVAPTASFTSSTSGLVATVNGTGSTDSDGSVTGYAWTFGDGGTATGSTATHTYAAAGTYTVTLTVTDDDGATGTKTGSVTVTAPATNQPIAQDAFARTLTAGWGTADVGGDWTRSGSSSNLSVGGGSGKIVLTGPGQQMGVYLGSVAQTSVDLTTQFSLDKVATGGGTQFSLQGRRIDSSNDYRATVALKAGGTATVSLVASGVTIAAPVTVSTAVAAGTALNVRLQVTGTAPTTVRAKVWLSGQAEPSAWTVQATDSTAGLQAPGGLGIIAYESGSATNGQQTLTVSSWKGVAP